ncbi:MAG: 30S ribosomal protein S21 [Candidatus Dojkabacteria bacterium]|nr:MAG: 30S ribosomal protein S21 [Candidatus Dojkabacteria bacterium]
MAVIVVHKNEAIDSVLRRFQRQVIKEGIISDVLDKRYFVSKSEAKRIKKHELQRSASRKRRRAKSKPRTVVKVKKKMF